MKRKQKLKKFDKKHKYKDLDNFKMFYFPRPGLKLIGNSTTPYESNRLYKEIKYRGPLSYRLLKFLGLIFMLGSITFGSVYVVLETKGIQISPFWGTVFEQLENLALPLFLLSAFTLILNRKQKATQILRIYLIGSILTYFGLLYIYHHYLIGIINTMSPELLPDEIKQRATDFFMDFLTSGLNYNIFLDLLLCTLFYFFTNYQPKKLNKKQLIAFRWCALIPVLYFIVSIVVTGLYRNGVISNMPIEAYVLLICRSPATYIVFFSLAFFLYSRERAFYKHGATKREYNEYLNSNACSLHLSIACCIILAVVSLFEFIFSYIPFMKSLGFGEQSILIFVTPFVMLTSYSRQYENRSLDVLGYLFFTLATLFVIVEAIFQLVTSS